MTTIATTTMLDKPLGDLRHEINDLRLNKSVRDYDMNKLCSIISISRESLKETGKYQQQILNQLQQFENSLAEINEILGTNAKEKTELEQQQHLGNLISMSFCFVFVYFVFEKEMILIFELN